MDLPAESLGEKPGVEIQLTFKGVIRVSVAFTVVGEMVSVTECRQRKAKGQASGHREIRSSKE